MVLGSCLRQIMSPGISPACPFHSAPLRAERLQDDAAPGALAALEGQQRGAGRGLEDVVDALAAQAGALEVLAGVDLPGDGLALLRRDEAHGLLAHLLDGDGVLAQVLLQADEDDWDVRAETAGLLDPLRGETVASAFLWFLPVRPVEGTYLVLHVIQGIWGVKREAHEDYVGLGICQRPQPLVVFLACCVP